MTNNHRQKSTDKNHQVDEETPFSTKQNKRLPIRKVNVPLDPRENT